MSNLKNSFATLSTEDLASVNGGDAAHEQVSKSTQDFKDAWNRGKHAFADASTAGNQLATGNIGGSAKSLVSAVKNAYAGEFDAVHGVTSFVHDLIPQAGA